MRFCPRCSLPLRGARPPPFFRVATHGPVPCAGCRCEMNVRFAPWAAVCAFSTFRVSGLTATGLTLCPFLSLRFSGASRPFPSVLDGQRAYGCPSDSFFRGYALLLRRGCDFLPHALSPLPGFPSALLRPVVSSTLASGLCFTLCLACSVLPPRLLVVVLFTTSYDASFVIAFRPVLFSSICPFSPSSDVFPLSRFLSLSPPGGGRSRSCSLLHVLSLVYFALSCPIHLFLCAARLAAFSSFILFSFRAPSVCPLSLALRPGCIPRLLCLWCGPPLFVLAGFAPFRGAIRFGSFFPCSFSSSISRCPRAFVMVFSPSSCLCSSSLPACRFASPYGSRPTSSRVCCFRRSLGFRQPVSMRSAVPSGRLAALLVPSRCFLRALALFASLFRGFAGALLTLLRPGCSFLCPRSARAHGACQLRLVMLRSGCPFPLAPLSPLCVVAHFWPRCLYFFPWWHFSSLAVPVSLAFGCCPAGLCSGVLCFSSLRLMGRVLFSPQLVLALVGLWVAVRQPVFAAFFALRILAPLTSLSLLVVLSRPLSAACLMAPPFRAPWSCMSLRCCGWLGVFGRAASGPLLSRAFPCGSVGSFRLLDLFCTALVLPHLAFLVRPPLRPCSPTGWVVPAVDSVCPGLA